MYLLHSSHTIRPQKPTSEGHFLLIEGVRYFTINLNAFERIFVTLKYAK